jgi:uncharacterized membrane protein YkvA (DUF1232 family)
VNRSDRWRYVRLGALVWKLPMYARIVWGVARDRRTPLHLKALLAAALAYLVLPIDLIPDAIPIVGQADDLTVLLLVLDLVVANAPPEVRRQHTELARQGAGTLDDDLARVRALLGDRYDRMRDRLPELLERYGDLRDPEAVRELVGAWRSRRWGPVVAEGSAGLGAVQPPAAVATAVPRANAATIGPSDPNLN